MKKIGFAFGGGGARGLAHVGILKVIEREKIPIYCISGSSMGSIIGAQYAVEPNIELVEQRVRDMIVNPKFAEMTQGFFKEIKSDPAHSIFMRAKAIIKFGYLHLVGETHYSLLGIEKLEEFVNMLIPDIDISETKIPFSCVATDLTNGREKLFTKGSLRKCVLASASIPGVFPPVEINGIYYNDGGSVNTTPITAIKKMGAEFLVACDVKSKLLRWIKPQKAKEIVTRSHYITGIILNEIRLKEADVVISPAVKHLHWTAFDKLDFLIAKGEKAAAYKMWEIKTKASLGSFLGRFLNLIK